MIAFGTRGDVQPAVALGKELKAKGHSVRILAGANFKDWIERHGLEAFASKIDIQSVMESDLGRDWIEKGGNPLMQMRTIKKLTDQTGWQSMIDAWAACRDAEVIFSSFTSDIYALSIAEKLRVPIISIPLQPALFPTRSGAATMNAPLPGRKSIINYCFGRLFLEPFNWRLSGKMVNRFRREVLSLQPHTRAEYLAVKRSLFTVQAFSRHIVPHADDWPSTIRTTGFWFLEEQNGWQPPRGLIEFLDAGEPPICIGFGSMVGHNIEQVTRNVIDGVRESGRRAVLLSGWAGIGNVEPGDRIYRLEAAPHEWLYPRVAAAVHHGGAGSTAASLRAGLPTVIVPHLGDQSFWGQRVYALGAGPKPISRNKLTAPALASAIRAATTSHDMKRRAGDLGTKIRAEDGIGEAVDAIEQYLRL
ncbi:MAG TPA: glycosyltransferase [Blastocatellia bacterium]|nr:glycosyltransferase [Blastocatellia bacterium]